MTAHPVTVYIRIDVERHAEAKTSHFNIFCLARQTNHFPDRSNMTQSLYRYAIVMAFVENPQRNLIVPFESRAQYTIHSNCVPIHESLTLCL